ncbi:hypothetical protein [Actinoplanes aureus]|uniref:hypothetical protein n=1 Tax=Actinoplanes aureus TaxID=2792083 RepID=UPI001E356B92|nr:hypothetical protein [Actinoplanes aureus]
MTKILWGRLRVVTVTAALGLLSPVMFAPVTAQAGPGTTVNAVVMWNSYAQTAIYEVARQSPTTTARSFAMVQGAVYDAVNAVAGAPYQPYLVAPRARPGDSASAAVAAAAHGVLQSLFPAQADALRARYDEALAAIPDGRSKSGGRAPGEAPAAARFATRVHHGAPRAPACGPRPSGGARGGGARGRRHDRLQGERRGVLRREMAGRH